MATHSRRRSSKSSSQSATWTIVNLAFLVLYTILTGIVLFNMYTYNFLAFRHINIIYTVVLALVFLLALILIIRKKAQLLTTILLIVFSLISGLTLFGFKSAIDVTANMNKTASFSETKMSIVVPKDSTISNVSELTSVQAPLNSDQSNIEELISKIKSEKDFSLETEAVDSYQKAYENLIAGESKAMVLNSAYSSLLELSYPDYESKIKTIYSYTISKEVKNSKSTTKTNANVFNIYISGIDTYGSISTVSRSDVNIIMTVNMKTHKVLLTTTPRDAYVQIPDGGNNQYDKLTHAGIYGVETSMKTLENLYGIDINYYARINFTSFIKLVDLLGGIEVYNNQAFTAHTNHDYSFPVGNVHLDSKGALAFVRERYSLSGGDNDRGKNQEKVISAIIDKLTSAGSISKISSIANGLQDSVQTNMSLDTLMTLANTQLSSGDHFTVTSQAITGTGSTGQLQSYAMPTASLYMMQLDDASLANAKQAISDTMEGK
ncbi:LCP family glycopolymer transferase CpsA [Streptococcus caballi]|uniref:LCP family glycopolymer transferase CpsA n=1 Tax=Streptococcus caballi TaxID=439220 RepID=UPI00036EF0C9|nr:LCP family protein [Streptococcus caballi]